MIARIAKLLRIQAPVLADEGLLMASGATVPSAVQGYQPGALFQDTTNGVLYVNEGTLASCSFKSIGSVSGLVVSEDGTTGVEISGDQTTGILLSGDMATGVNITGVVSKAFRAGSYSSPLAMVDGTELVTVGGNGAGDAFYLGYGCYLHATGEDAKVIGVSVTSEITTADGTDRIQSGQFISSITATGNLKTLGGDATAGMYGAWCKVTANVASTVDAGSRVAALWVDNQMNCVCSGEEYGVFLTTGGSKPDAVFGLDTSSSGWAALFSFSAAAAAKEPIITNALVPATAPGADTVGADKALKVDINGTPYYIPLYDTLHA